MPEPSRRRVAGRLEGLSPVELVWSLAREARTGVLTVEDGRRGKSLWFEHGRIVFATTSIVDERLGERLLRHGRIRLEHLERALAMQAAEGGRIGARLVEAGALDETTLRETVRDQLRSIVRELLQWERGAYAFTETALPTSPEVTPELETAELVLGGVRACASVRRVRAGAGPTRRRVGLVPGWREVAAGLGLEETERLVLAALERGPTSLGELCREVYLPGFDVARTLWAFRLLGLAAPALGDGRESAQLIATTDIASALVALARDAETGVLRGWRDGTERAFHLRGGRCVFATSSDPDDGLLAFLLRRGVISLGDADEVSRRTLSNKRVGTLLREMGVLDDRELKQSVREHLQEIVQDTVTWCDGEWLFEPGALPTAETITLDLPVEALVAEGIRRIGSWTRVLAGCGGLDRPIGLTPRYLEALDAMGAGVEEWRVVAALREPQTPRRVCRQSEASELETCRLLWTLVVLGAVEYRSPDDPDLGVTTNPLPRVAEGVSGASVAASVAEGHPDEPDDLLPEEETLTLTPGRSIVPRAGRGPVAAPGAPAEAERPVGVASRQAPSPIAERTTGSTTLLSRDEVARALGEPPPALSAPETDPEPAWNPPADLDDAIARFNEVHRVVWRTLHAEVGAGAANFVRSCCTGDEAEAADPVGQAELHGDGTWSPEGLREAAVRARLADPWRAYRRVVAVEIARLREHLGDERTAHLERQLGELALERRALKPRLATP